MAEIDKAVDAAKDADENDILKNIDPKLMYRILSTRIMAAYLRRLVVTVIGIAGLVGGAGVLALTYATEKMRDEANAMQQQIQTAQTDAKAALQKIEKTSRDVQADAKKAADIHQSFNGVLANLQSQAGKDQIDLNTLAGQVKSENDQLDALIKPDMQKALAAIAATPPGQMNALTAGLSSGSLLITTGQCQAPWIAADDMDGTVLAAVSTKSKTGAGSADTVTFRLTQDNVPRMPVTMPTGASFTAKMSTTTVKLAGRTPPSAAMGYEISKCDSDCKHNSPFTNVPVQLDNVSGISAAVGTDKPDIVHATQKQYRVHVCRLKA